MGNIAASVLARLKNKSKEQGIPLQQLLNLFCQEEFIRRLSGSNYKENLILKGGFLLYSISGFTTRPTVDADYLLKNYSNDLDTVDFEGRKLQEAIYETLSNRGTPYEKDSVAVISRLAEDSNILKRWDNFCKKILKYKLDFNHVIKVIIDFLQPPYEALILEDELFEDWSHEKKGYV